MTSYIRKPHRDKNGTLNSDCLDNGMGEEGQKYEKLRALIYKHYIIYKH